MVVHSTIVIDSQEVARVLAEHMRDQLGVPLDQVVPLLEPVAQTVTVTLPGTPRSP